RFLSSRLPTDRIAGVYIDARILGSTAQFSDNTIPITTRCTALFRDILVEIHGGLQNSILQKDSAKGSALGRLDELATVVTQPCTTVVAEKSAARALFKETDRKSAASSLSAGSGLAATVGAMSETQEELEAERSAQFDIKVEDKIVFPAIA